jgi:hypothetical protein
VPIDTVLSALAASTHVKIASIPNERLDAFVEVMRAITSQVFSPRNTTPAVGCVGRPRASQENNQRIVAFSNVGVATSPLVGRNSVIVLA